jgi:hypothetical protein
MQSESDDQLLLRGGPFRPIVERRPPVVRVPLPSARRAVATASLWFGAIVASAGAAWTVGGVFVSQASHRATPDVWIPQEHDASGDGVGVSPYPSVGARLGASTADSGDAPQERGDVAAGGGSASPDAALGASVAAPLDPQGSPGTPPGTPPPQVTLPGASPAGPGPPPNGGPASPTTTSPRTTTSDTVQASGTTDPTTTAVETSDTLPDDTTPDVTDTTDGADETDTSEGSGGGNSGSGGDGGHSG